MNMNNLPTKETLKTGVFQITTCANWYFLNKNATKTFPKTPKYSLPNPKTAKFYLPGGFNGLSPRYMLSIPSGTLQFKELVPGSGRGPPKAALDRSLRGARQIWQRAT